MIEEKNDIIKLKQAWKLLTELKGNYSLTGNAKEYIELILNEIDENEIISKI